MTTKTPLLPLKIKDESGNDEMKKYAESAVNELLGWYGYCDNDKHEYTKSYRTNRVIKPIAPHSPLEGSIPSPDNSIDRQNSIDEQITSPMSSKSATNRIKDGCSWCKTPVLDISSFLVTPDGNRYCTESCFSQSRRASFKRVKTCDWCKHIRHAVNSIDFQDGASQLQFCSDKCLNQYKMHIFCKETQAHLDMNPHLRENKNITQKYLITPELWLKNCRSRSASPQSDHSRNSTSPVSHVTSTATVLNQPANVFPQKPVITVTPTSKLLSNSFQSTQNNAFVEYYHRSPSSTVISLRNSRRKRHMYLNEQNNKTKTNSPTAYLTKGKRPRSSAPDLDHILPKVEKTFVTNNPVANTVFAAPSNTSQCPISLSAPLPVPPCPGQPSTPTSAAPMTFVDSTAPRPSVFDGTQSAVTMLVPYPLLLPFPVPIPIPLCLDAFIRAADLKLKSDNSVRETLQNETGLGQSNNDARLWETNEPLDFTKVNETKSTDMSNERIEKLCNTINKSDVKDSKPVTRKYANLPKPGRQPTES